MHYLIAIPILFVIGAFFFIGFEIENKKREKEEKRKEVKK